MKEEIKKIACKIKLCNNSGIDNMAMLVCFVKYPADGSVLKFLEQHMVKRYHENRKVMFQNANTEL